MIHDKDMDEWLKSPEGRDRLLMLEKRTTTQAYKKMKQFFEELVLSEKFQVVIVEVRKKCGIPENGFASEEEYRSWRLNESNEKSANRLFRESIKICAHYKIGQCGWADTVEDFIGMNKIVSLNETDMSLCEVVCEKELYDEPLGKWLGDDLNNTYPVSIRLSPYATKRDILDYVEKMYRGFIKPVQDQFRDPDVKIGTYREKSVLVGKRNSIIYDNKELPLKEIYKLIPKDLRGGIDEGGIGKVISLERKRRKQL